MDRKPNFQPNEHVPTEATKACVSELNAAGVPQVRIAARYNMNVATLRKHYRAELDEKLDDMNAALGRNLYQDALAGNKKDREFWLRTRAGFVNAKSPEEIEAAKKPTVLEVRLTKKDIQDIEDVEDAG